MQKKKNHFVGFMHFFCFSFPLTILQFLKALNNKKRREKGKGKKKKVIWSKYIESNFIGIL